MESTVSVYTHALGAIPPFLLYLAVAAALVTLFFFAYQALTRHDEIALIRQGNTGAALALSGALLGFCLPLSKAMEQAQSVPDMLIWASLGFVMQLVAYGITNLIVPGLSRRLEDNALAPAVILAGVSLACGLLSAAAMTE